MEMVVERECGLFGSKTVGERQTVWMSHGDEVAVLPDGFSVVARSRQGSIAIQNPSSRFYELHYHPEVDEIFIQPIKDAGLYDSIWQALAVFLPERSVGVQGDKRTHSHVVGLRAITSEDGMTADWYYFEHKFLVDVSRKICNSV